MNEMNEDATPYAPHGHERLWLWFGMTRASWLTMPRVMMHAMPEDWQDRMAALCEEWDAAWDSDAMPAPSVHAIGDNGKFTKWPDWLLNYRHPDMVAINAIRATGEGEGHD